MVLQYPGASLRDYDRLVRIEGELEKGIGSLGGVDGHDFGSNEGIIFVFTDEPQGLFARIREILKPDDVEDMRCAFREVEGQEYTMLWPPDMKAFSVK
jgi:hypothetical protein